MREAKREPAGPARLRSGPSLHQTCRLRNGCYTSAVRNTRLVYSTGAGDLRPADARPPRDPAPSPGRDHAPAIPADDGIVRIFRERGGRGGKTVTVIRGLRERGPALDARAAELKRLCGAGGTVKDGAVEIQGDHRERVAERLRALGFTVKLAGS